MVSGPGVPSGDSEYRKGTPNFMSKLTDILEHDTCATARADTYTVTVSEYHGDDPAYSHTVYVAVEAMPPHVDIDFRSLEEVLNYFANGDVLSMSVDEFN